jgi:hypothetical protein
MCRRRQTPRTDGGESGRNRQAVACVSDSNAVGASTAVAQRASQHIRSIPDITGIRSRGVLAQGTQIGRSPRRGRWVVGVRLFGSVRELLYLTASKRGDFYAAFPQPVDPTPGLKPLDRHMSYHADGRRHFRIREGRRVMPMFEPVWLQPSGDFRGIEHLSNRQLAAANSNQPRETRGYGSGQRCCRISKGHILRERILA